MDVRGVENVSASRCGAGMPLAVLVSQARPLYDNFDKCSKTKKQIMHSSLTSAGFD